MLQRIARLAIAAPRRIIGFAVFVFIAAAVFGVPVADSLSPGGFQDPRSESARAIEVGITPSVAATAVALPSSFPGDPADRLIYATAIEHGWRLVTKDRRLRSHRHPRPVTVW